ncbi:MAG: acylphosphatase [Flavisolibacter sp.]
MPSMQIIISGRVQGVFYRATALKQAKRIGLRGWIRNNEGGDVEAVATGSEAQLNEFIQWCWLGPAGAKVTRIDTRLIEFKFFENFVIKDS